MHKLEGLSISAGPSFAKQNQTRQSNTSFAAALEQAQGGVDRFKIKQSPAPLSSAEQELQAFVALNPEERFFEMTLRSLGISKEEYAAMGPAEKEEVARVVQQRIAERMKDNAENGRAAFELV